MVPNDGVHTQRLQLLQISKKMQMQALSVNKALHV